MSTPVVGVTGTIGTGKSTFARFLTEDEGTCIDADQVAKDLMRPGYPAHEEVVEEFGKEIIDEDGYLQPDKLAEVVFGDEEKLETLESILHPLVIEEMADRIEQADSSFYVLEVPLLFESGSDELCDWVVVVTAPEDRVNERLEERDMDPEDVERRRSRQLSEDEKIRRADEVVENDGSPEELRERARSLARRIRNRSLEDVE